MKNTQQRHLWPGIETTKIGSGRQPDEVLNQIRLVRQQSGAGGEIHWSFRPLLADRSGISSRLARDLGVLGVRHQCRTQRSWSDYSTPAVLSSSHTAG